MSFWGRVLCVFLLPAPNFLTEIKQKGSMIVDMEHDDAPVGELYSRRDAMVVASRAGLALVASSGLAQLVSAIGATQKQTRLSIVASPQLEEGPFFVDGKFNRSDLIKGSKRDAVRLATPLELQFVVQKLSGDSAKPLKNAQLDIWSCDASGEYANQADEDFMRAYQITDGEGVVNFTTIIPGWYPGRTPHIHLKVRSFSESHNVTAEFTSQVFFPEDLTKVVYAQDAYKSRPGPDTPHARDGIFNQKQADGSRAGVQMTLDMKRVLGQPRYRAKFVIGLSDSNFGKRSGGTLDWNCF